jgi:hypothetical protein
MNSTSTWARSPCISQTRVAHRNYARRRARQIAYGRWHPWADAAPVRDHVRQLRQAGASYRAIADAAHVSPSTVRNLISGCQRQRSQHLADRIGSAQAQRLLAVGPATCGDWRNACGSRRRLQALVAIGHLPAHLADLLEMSEPRVKRLLHSQTQRVSAITYVKVCALYRQLWDQAPDHESRYHRSAVEAAHKQAEMAGWPPPMALDDDRIDDPTYRLRSAWRMAAGTSSETTSA